MKKLLSNIWEYKQENGLVFYICNNEDNSRATEVCLSVKSGAAYEKIGEKGWFHFLEHLLIYNQLYINKEIVDNSIDAFNYAYTSFYETSYFFKSDDSTGEILKNSFSTAKNIMDGNTLNENTFEKTKEDVLCEYSDYISRNWYSQGIRQLKPYNMSFPIGLREDIEKVNFQKLRMLHSEYYNYKNATIIIASPHSFERVLYLINTVFNEESSSINSVFEYEEIYLGTKNKCNKEAVKVGDGAYTLLAWYKRSKLSNFLLLREYVLIALVTRTIEMAVLKTQNIYSTDCTVEIFNSDNYIFKLRLFHNSKILSEYNVSHIINQVKINIEIFEAAKKEVYRQLKEQCKIGGEIKYINLLNLCKEKFLFNEPIFHYDNEFERCSKFLVEIDYMDVEEKFYNIMNQFAI